MFLITYSLISIMNSQPTTTRARSGASATSNTSTSQLQLEEQVQAAFEDEWKVNDKDGSSDGFFKKRLIFIRHGNSIWNKMKGQGAAAKFQAFGQGVLEFAKTTYYDTDSHKKSLVMDAPLSEIGICQSKALSNFLPKQLHDLQRQLQSAQNYLESHNKCDHYIHEASAVLDNMLLPINSTHLQGQHGPDNSDLFKIQLYLNRAKAELSTSIIEFERRTAKDVERLQHLISIVSVLLTPSSDSVVVCSNLRRAVSTAIIALWDRFEVDKEENLYMVTSLQELGRGVDSLSHQDTGKAARDSQLNSLVKGIGSINQYIMENDKSKLSNGKSKSDKMESEKKEKKRDSLKRKGKRDRTESNLELSEFEEHCDDLNMLNHSMSKVNADKMRRFYAERLKKVEMTCSLSQMNSAEIKKKDKMENRKEADRKIDLFMDWVFNDESNAQRTTFVVIGHSNWIREFFKKYMDQYHELKTEKLKNCGVVAVDVYRNFHFKNNRVNQFSVENVTPIYEGNL